MKRFWPYLTMTAVILLAPLGVAQAAWTETVLFSFNYTDGASPEDGLIFDAKGNLYGTVEEGGGLESSGAVFKLAAPAAGKTAWTETVLLPFNASEGAGGNPYGSLIFDAKGNLYGTANLSGPGFGYEGTVFKLTPPAAGKTAWAPSVLESFGGPNGSYPYSGLISDAKGNLYGTTGFGGTLANGSQASGTVFRLTPPAVGKTTWTQTILSAFNGAVGGVPVGGLIFDKAGNLYGTTSADGRYSDGAVFKLTPPTAGKTAWTQTVLLIFNGTNGANSYANLILDAKGNLYGTTEYGGKFGFGTVFKLSPPAAGKTAWTQTILVSFNASTIGAAFYPDAGLTFDAKGNLYGTTFNGGAHGGGTVFQLTPPAAGKTAWTETILFSFNGTDGSGPAGSLLFDAKGNLYGTTEYGGKFGFGTVFKLAP